MRRKKETSKVKQTNKAKQHSTPKAVTFPRKISCLGWDSKGGDGIHHLSRGVTVAENLSMGVNQGNYYVLGGYGKFFLHRGVPMHG